MTTTSQTPTPARTHVHQQPTGRQLWIILGALMSGLFLSALDQTVVATALPTIAGDLHRADLLSWVVTAYLLTSTATAPLYGKIGDLYGRKRIYQIAIVIFVVSSVLCALATSMLQLIIFRGLQGAGAGGILTLSFAIIGDVVPLRERGKYQGYFGAVFLVSSVVGPLFGGFAVDQLTWQWVFWINLPLGLVTLAIVQASLRLPIYRTHHSVDWLGALLIMSGVSALLIAGQSGGKELAWASVSEVGLILAGIALLAAFILWERGRSEPLLPMDLFRIKAFTVANVMAFVCGVAMFGVIVFIQQYLQVVRGVAATESGLRSLPLLVGVMTASTIAGRITSRTGRYRKFPIMGTAIIVVGTVLLSMTVGAHDSLWSLAGAMVVFGAGLGMTMQTLVLASQNSVDRAQIGVATSTSTFFRSMGGSIGASGLGALLTAQLNSHLRAGGLPVSSGHETLLSTPGAVAHLPAPIHEIIATSYSAALHTTFLAAVPIAVVGFAISWMLPENRLRGAEDVPPVEMAEPAF